MGKTDEIINTIDDRIRDEVDFGLSRPTEDIETDIYQLIDEELDSSLIYTDDCWDIAKELIGTNSFSQYDMCDNITELAFSAMREEVFNQLDIDDLIKTNQELLEEQDEEEEE